MKDEYESKKQQFKWPSEIHNYVQAEKQFDPGTAILGKVEPFPMVPSDGSHSGVAFCRDSAVWSLTSHIGACVIRE